MPCERREPYDGKPYYCKSCGLGWAEYTACEIPGCELESEADAKARAAKAKKRGDIATAHAARHKAAMRLTDTQQRALRMIVSAGGGAMTKDGRVMCAGEVSDSEIHSDGERFDTRTWLRLAAFGLIEGQDGRFIPTDLGRSQATNI